MLSEPVDLLVLGGGMAGLAAAARTVERGGSAVLVEKGQAVGGSATFAEFIWTAPNLEVMREVNPDGDPELGAALIGDYQDARDWVRGLGVEVRPAVDLLGFGRGHGTDLNALFRTEERIVREAPGSDVLLEAEPTRLTLSDGAVTGAEIRLGSGERRTIAARSTLLAMGGFAGDPEARARHLG